MVQLTFNALFSASAALSCFFSLPSIDTLWLPFGGSLLLDVAIMNAGFWLLAPLTPIRRTR